MKAIKYLICLFILSVVLSSVILAVANTPPTQRVIKDKEQNWYLKGDNSDSSDKYWNNTVTWVDYQNMLHLIIVKGTNIIYSIELKPSYVKITSMQANGKVIANYELIPKLVLFPISRSFRTIFRDWKLWLCS
jgi:hypothetical protein